MKNFVLDVQDFKSALEKTECASSSASLKIPKIVLIGNEKSGKSRLLERMIDSSIYIKDQKVERPVHVRIAEVAGVETWFELEDLQGSRFNSGEDLGTELIKAASSLGFSEQESLDSPVRVKFNSSKLCADLLFIDFPGIKHNQSWNAFREFAAREFSSAEYLLVGVLPVNDLQNQARVLKLLSDLDPQRSRSTVVLTKLDLVSADDMQKALDSFMGNFPFVSAVGKIPANVQKEILCVDKFGEKVHSAIPKFAPYERHLGLRAVRENISSLMVKHVRSFVISIRDKLQKEVFSLQQKCFNVKSSSSIRGDVSVSTLVKSFGDNMSASLAGRSTTADAKEQNVDLTEGAKINMIFEKTLPEKLKHVNSAFDSQDNREVVYAIKNSRGVRTGFFIPDKAFNTVARQRMERFKWPFTECLRLIMVQMKGAINRCGRLSLQSYPLLLDEVTRKSTEFILTNEMLVQDAIESCLKMEECYINSANEDFAKQVDHANALAETGHAFKVKTSLMSVNLSKTGTLSIIHPETETKHRYWFVLSSDKLQWFKLKDKKTFVGSLKLENLRMMDGNEDGSICMFFLTGKRVSEDYERLNLIAENEDEAEIWKTQLLRAGVFPVNDSFQDLSNDLFLNGQLNESVALIRHLTLEYMKIIKKNLRDKFTKIVVYYLIKRTFDFVKNDLLLYLYSLKKDEELLKTSSDTVSLQQRLVNDLEATKDAIKLADNLCFGKVQSFFAEGSDSTQDILNRTFGDDFLAFP